MGVLSATPSYSSHAEHLEWFMARCHEQSIFSLNVYELALKMYDSLIHDESAWRTELWRTVNVALNVFVTNEYVYELALEMYDALVDYESAWRTELSWTSNVHDNSECVCHKRVMSRWICMSRHWIWMTNCL